MAKRGKKSASPRPSMPMFKPPTVRDQMASHADGATRSLMDQHPLTRKMRSDMTKALMGVARNHGVARTAAPRGRARSLFS